MLEGQVVKARLTEVHDFGVYLEINQSRVFVKIVDIDWTNDPLTLDRLKVGELFEVKILKYSEVPQKGGVNYLGSIKDAKPEEDPWKKYEYTTGKIFKGLVSNLYESGAVVRLSTGVVGLIRSPVLHNHLSINQEVSVSIRSADLTLQRIELNLEVPPHPVDD